MCGVCVCEGEGSVSLCFSDYIISIVLSSRSLILSSVLYILMLSPFTDFYLGFLFSYSKISIWFFFISSVSLRRFSVSLLSLSMSSFVSNVFLTVH